MTRPVWPCPCGSGISYYQCCKPLLDILEILPAQAEPPSSFADTLVVEWLSEYSPATARGFYAAAGRYLCQVSCYLTSFAPRYLKMAFPGGCSDADRANQAYFSLKHNTLLSILGSSELLCCGLLLQSGALLRCAVEDSLALVDLCLNRGQMDIFLHDKYRTSNLVNRVGRYVPSCVKEWYSYFSQNFTHTGPLHRGMVMPRKCWGDNRVLVEGLQNLVRSVVCYHICLERAYAARIRGACFWQTEPETGNLRFDENSRVFTWAERLGKDLVARFPPDKKNELFV